MGELEKTVNQSDDGITKEIEHTKVICRSLFSTSFYKKIGAEGIFAIVEKSKSMGINPLSALNGGMYFVQGKVELNASLMNQLIRQAGHSIQKDEKSDDTICILHGKRADNGDVWEASFSIEEAKAAGIYRSNWTRYPKDMLFARALSRLGRQLFPDVIKGCYVKGEIWTGEIEVKEEDKTRITADEVEMIEELLIEHFDLRQMIMEKMNIGTFGELYAKDLPKVVGRIRTLIQEREDNDENN